MRYWVKLCHELELNRTVYMGCSMGGHLAPDLALNYFNCAYRPTGPLGKVYVSLSRRQHSRDRPVRGDISTNRPLERSMMSSGWRFSRGSGSRNETGRPEDYRLDGPTRNRLRKSGRTVAYRHNTISTTASLSPVSSGIARQRCVGEGNPVARASLVR